MAWGVQAPRRDPVGTGDDATVYTDEWPGYKRLPDCGRGHDTVIHLPGQRVWATDRDGHGV
jgi:hypothetical protein